MTTNTLEMPDALSPEGQRAYAVVVAFMAKHDMLKTGGCKAFYSPDEWADRGEQYGLKSELVLVHDGGDLAAICNLDYERYPLHDGLQADLQAAGFFMEGCTCWYSAIYKQ